MLNQERSYKSDRDTFIEWNQIYVQGMPHTGHLWSGGKCRRQGKGWRNDLNIANPHPSFRTFCDCYLLWNLNIYHSAFVGRICPYLTLADWGRPQNRKIDMVLKWAHVKYSVAKCTSFCVSYKEIFGSYIYSVTETLIYIFRIPVYSPYTIYSMVQSEEIS